MIDFRDGIMILGLCLLSFGVGALHVWQSGLIVAGVVLLYVALFHGGKSNGPTDTD